MPDHFDILAASRTVLVRSAQLTEDVEELHAITKPSGVTFVRDVPYAAYAAGGAHKALEPIALHIEHIMKSRPHVVSGASVQLVDAQGLLTNAVQFLVSYSGVDAGRAGPFQDTVTITVQVLHDRETFDTYFNPVVERLAALAK